MERASRAVGLSVEGNQINESEIHFWQNSRLRLLKDPAAAGALGFIELFDTLCLMHSLELPVTLFLILSLSVQRRWGSRTFHTHSLTHSHSLFLFRSLSRSLALYLRAEDKTVPTLLHSRSLSSH